MTLALLEMFIRVYGSREGTRRYLDTMRAQTNSYGQAQAQAHQNAWAQHQADKKTRHAHAYGMGADQFRAQAEDMHRAQQAHTHRYGWTEYRSDGSKTAVTMTIDAEPGSYEWKD